MWNEHNYTVVWTFIVITILWDWNENWPFPVMFGHWWIFQVYWHIDCSTLKASSFRILSGSAGIPSPSLTLLIEILPKTHLTSCSRIFGSRWVATPLRLSRSLRSFFVKFFCVFLSPLLNIFCFCQVQTLSIFYCAHSCMKCSLDLSYFLEEVSILSHSIVFLYFFALFI